MRADIRLDAEHEVITSRVDHVGNGNYESFHLRFLYEDTEIVFESYELDHLEAVLEGALKDIACLKAQRAERDEDYTGPRSLPGRAS